MEAISYRHVGGYQVCVATDCMIGLASHIEPIKIAKLHRTHQF